jgi:hypothetical protein
MVLLGPFEVIDQAGALQQIRSLPEADHAFVEAVQNGFDMRPDQWPGLPQLSCGILGDFEKVQTGTNGIFVVHYYLPVNRMPGRSRKPVRKIIAS